MFNEDTHRVNRAGSLILLVISLLFGASAQVLITVWQDRVQLPESLAARLQIMWPHPGSVLVAILLLLPASALFVNAVNSLVTAQLVHPASLEHQLWLTRSNWIFCSLFGIGGLLWLAVIERLATTHYDVLYPRLFVLSLLFPCVALIWYERNRIHLSAVAVLWRDRQTLVPEIMLIGFAIILFFWLSSFDLTNWYYSCLGDEYAFYYPARAFAIGGNTVNIFDQSGPFEIVPVFSAYIEGKLMAVLSTGWKEAIILEVAAALILLYLLARVMFGRRVAILTLGLLVSAHYLQAYVHTGYANIEALLPSVAAILLYYYGCRNGSWLLLALAGMWAGLGWYTFFTSRSTIGILLLGTLLIVRPRDWLMVGGWIVTGFIAMVAPIVAVSKSLVLTKMFDMSTGGATETGLDRLLLPLYNVGRSLLAFNYNEHNGPYLSGSLAEPITAVLFLLGLGYAVGTWNDVRSRLLLVWFALGMVVTGVFSKYDYVTVSRLNFVLPVIALLAARASDRIITVVEYSMPGRARNLMGVLAVVVLLSAVTFSNLYRWLVVSPSVVPSLPEAVTMRILASPRCAQAARPPLFVEAEGISGPLHGALDAHGPHLDLVLARYTDPPTWIATMRSRCVIFFFVQDEQVSNVLLRIQQRYPGLRAVDEADKSGTVIVKVFYPTRSVRG